jgi:hypothetical protein
VVLTQKPGVDIVVVVVVVVLCFGVGWLPGVSIPLFLKFGFPCLIVFPFVANEALGFLLL